MGGILLDYFFFKNDDLRSVLNFVDNKITKLNQNYSHQKNMQNVIVVSISAFTVLL